MKRLIASAFSLRDYAADLEDDLAERNCGHLRVRPRGGALVIESGDKKHPHQHARLRRDTVHLWLVDMPNGLGRWAPTPYRQPLAALVDLLLSDFGWAMAPRPELPQGPSGARSAAEVGRSAAQAPEHRSLTIEHRTKLKKRKSR